MIGAFLLVSAVLGAAFALRNPTNRVSLQDLSFDVPASWSVHTDLAPTTGMGQTLALIGTLPWGACAAWDANCHYRERLEPHQIQLQVDVGISPDNDFCAYARERPDLEPRPDGIHVTETHYFRIDGRPAIATSYALDTPDYYLSTAWRKWEIGPIDTTNELYRIFAMWRSPGDDEFVAALDRLVASIQVGPSRGAASPDCSDPFPSPSPLIAGGIQRR